MKTAVTTIIAVLLSFSLTAQFSLEVHSGGSNFLGTSLNATYDLTLVESIQFGIRPKLGVGAMWPFGFGAVNIVHGGMEYFKGRWAAGIEASGFFASPLVPGSENGFIDLLVYPHVTRSSTINNRVYFRFSAGLYFAFTAVQDFNINRPEFFWEQGIIPGISFTYGYRFND